MAAKKDIQVLIGGKGNTPAGMNPLPQAASTFLFVSGYVRQN